MPFGARHGDRDARRKGTAARAGELAPVFEIFAAEYRPRGETMPTGTTENVNTGRPRHDDSHPSRNGIGPPLPVKILRELGVALGECR